MQVYNLIDWPAGVVPWGKVSAADEQQLRSWPTRSPRDILGKKCRDGCMEGVGLPTAVQVASLPMKDETVLRVMRELESARNPLQ